MKIALGMSGGVDSTVCAKLLQDDGHEVVAVFMKNWEDGTENCTVTEDLLAAEKVAKKLGIEFHSVNFSKEYWENVFEYFISENKAGRTPNPDILCNKFIKFDSFLKFSEKIGADKIAMGHYAAVNFNKENQLYELKIPRDLAKDQTYFLHALNQYQLSRVLFPLENLTKTEVRKIALENNFINANKKDSTGICFIGERNYTEFLFKYISKNLGNIVDFKSREIIGEHIGLSFYTIGQSKTLGIGGVKGFPEGKWYVVDKNFARNQLLVSQNEEFLMNDSLQAKNMNWITNPIAPLSGGTNANIFKCLAKVRYRDEGVSADVEVLSENEIFVKFTEKIRGITPGQSVVLYDGDVCLGGGEIC